MGNLVITRRIRRFGRSVAIFTLLCACSIVVGASSIAAAEPYNIYVILSLTGPFGLIGAEEAVSLRILEEVVNKKGGIRGRPVHFVIADDQTQPAVAVQLANAILEKHLPVLLRPTGTASCLAVTPLVTAGGPLNYCYSPAVQPPAGSYMFSAGLATREQVLASLRFLQAKGFRRLALLATTDATGQAFENEFSAMLGARTFGNMHFITREHFAIADVSVAAQAAKIKAAGPDAIVLATVGPSTGTALRNFSDVGLVQTPVMSNQGNILHVQLLGYAAFMPKTIYFTAPRSVARDTAKSGPVRDAQRAYYSAFRARGIEPEIGHNVPWDPTLIVIDALRRLGTGATPKQLLDYMEALHGYAGTNGIIDFRDGSQRGLGLNSVVIERWDATNNKLAAVSEFGGTPLKR